jgi:hypothetical protein
MYVPVVTILRASGWRISDVVSLRYDSFAHLRLGRFGNLTPGIAKGRKHQGQALPGLLTDAIRPRYPTGAIENVARPHWIMCKALLEIVESTPDTF